MDSNFCFNCQTHAKHYKFDLSRFTFIRNAQRQINKRQVCIRSKTREKLNYRKGPIQIIAKPINYNLHYMPGYCTYNN